MLQISKKLVLKQKEVTDVLGGEDAWKNVDRTAGVLLCCCSSSSPSLSPFILDCLVAFEFGFLYQLGRRIVEGIETMSPHFHTEKQTPFYKTVQSVKQDPSKIPLKSKP